ncbi:hypothetical protein NX784_28020 [Massilia pinisoli]|uniref:Uncharacterized protein n=1 Tax=Massilia pinisoli TaxID=1772194 RepID=A0ABT1ZZZ4_9BURK|nr:hypothetical protein [Massilia pinisoli]MCS0585434.1 hypothetical protein [Massilia pinisoli]
MRDLSASVAKLRARGDHPLADQVEYFMHGMPSVDSERRKLQRMLTEQRENRRQDRDQDRKKGSSK